MALPHKLSRRFLLVRLLRSSLVAGALLDLLVAAALVLPARLPALQLSSAGGGIARVAAVLLLMTAVLYLIAIGDVRRYSGIVVVASAGRLLGAGALLSLRLAEDGPAIAGALASAWLLLGLSHALFFWPLRQ